jgi:futalosine hydrolase
MRVLLVAATDRELTAATGADASAVDTLVTGVGMVATAAHLARTLATSAPDLVLNVGVCGAFDRALTPGTVVNVVTDGLSEFGVEDGPVFVPADAVGLIAPNDPPYTAGRLVNPFHIAIPALAALPRVDGITVNTVHGDDASIAAVMARCQPQVESMEGAAFMYACLLAGVRFAQIRSVSNVVERRNRDAWQLDEALHSLGRVTQAILAQSREEA